MDMGSRTSGSTRGLRPLMGSGVNSLLGLGLVKLLVVELSSLWIGKGLVGFEELPEISVCRGALFYLGGTSWRAREKHLEFRAGSLQGILSERCSSFWPYYQRPPRS